MWRTRKKRMLTTSSRSRSEAARRRRRKPAKLSSRLRLDPPLLEIEEREGEGGPYVLHPLVDGGQPLRLPEERHRLVAVDELLDLVEIRPLRLHVRLALRDLEQAVHLRFAVAGVV